MVFDIQMLSPRSGMNPVKNVSVTAALPYKGPWHPLQSNNASFTVLPRPSAKEKEKLGHRHTQNIWLNAQVFISTTCLTRPSSPYYREPHISAPQSIPCPSIVSLPHPITPAKQPRRDVLPKRAKLLEAASME